MTQEPHIPFHRVLFRLFRTEYLTGLCIGALATLIMWYRPSNGVSWLTIVYTGLYTGLLYFSGFLANAVGDYELDANYDNFKREIPGAVTMIGKISLLRLMWVMIFVGGAFGVVLSLSISSWIPLVAGGAGILAGTGYSLEPFRWKTRGFLSHFFSISYAVFFLPMFIFVGVLTRSFSAQVILISCGFALAHYALEIGNQLKDFDFDQRMGIYTLPSTHPRISCLIGLVILIIGLGCELFALATYFHLAVKEILALSLIAIVTHAEAITLYGRMVFSREISLSAFSTLNYANWQALGMVSYLLMAILIRILQK